MIWIQDISLLIEVNKSYIFTYFCFFLLWMEVLMRWNNVFSAHASMLPTDKRSHWRRPKFLSKPFDASWLLSGVFFRIQLLLLQVHTEISASPTLSATDTDEVRRWNWTVAMYCAVYLPVVQPPLQVLEVLSFLGNPARENGGKAEWTQGSLYSMHCLFFAKQYVKGLSHAEISVNYESV